MAEKTIELLSPAGDMERLRMSLAYGADAVYLGYGALTPAATRKISRRRSLRRRFLIATCGGQRST